MHGEVKNGDRQNSADDSQDEDRPTVATKCRGGRRRGCCRVSQAKQRGVLALRNFDAGLLAQAGDSLTFINQNRLAPYNQQWQVSLQHEFPGRVVAEAAYVGMLSLKQLETYNLNELSDIYLPLGTAQNAAVRNPFLGAFPATSSLGQAATVSQRQ